MTCGERSADVPRTPSDMWWRLDIDAQSQQAKGAWQSLRHGHSAPEREEWRTRTPPEVQSTLSQCQPVDHEWRSPGAPSHAPSNMSRFADIGVELAVTGCRLMSEDALKHKSLEFVDTSSIKLQLPKAFSSVRRRLSQSTRREMPLCQIQMLHIQAMGTITSRTRA